MNRLKIGITNSSYGVYEFKEAIKKIGEQGYDCIDYQGFVDIETEFFRLPEKEFMKVLAEQKALFSSHGLEVSQAHAPWRTPKDGDPEERQKWLTAMKKAIRGTNALECHRFVVHPLFPYMETDEHPDEVWKMNEEVLATLADYAKEYGVTVCLENMPFENHPIHSTEQILALVRDVDHPNLKVCFDTGHANCTGENVANSVRLLGRDLLKIIHVHDNYGESDLHNAPYDGTVDWSEFIEALYEIGYGGVMNLEVKIPEDLDEEQAREAELSLVKTAKLFAGE